MNDTETIIQEIIEADLQRLFNIMEPVKEDTDELHEAYLTMKYGKKIKYHIEWGLKELIEIRERQGTVIIQRKEYPIEEYWDEEEERRTAARKALLEYYMEDEKPYEKRK